MISHPFADVLHARIEGIISTGVQAAARGRSFQRSLLRQRRTVHACSETVWERQVGVTVLELIIASSILLTLASAALPVVRHAIVRQKEFELQRDLRQMRDAIDRYKDYSDRGLIRVELGSEGYPPDLDTLVKGVNIGAGAEEKIRFLRRIPKDPITGRAEWNLQSVQDDPDSTSWGGNNVYDVQIPSHLGSFRRAKWPRTAQGLA